MASVHYHQGEFPPSEMDWPSLAPAIESAAAAMARYDGMLAAVPNADLLAAPLQKREATLSSRIEGTQASLDEVMLAEAGQPPEGRAHREDITEIINHNLAMRRAVQMLDQGLPLSMRVLLDAHRILLSGGRGANRGPGQYRSIQNWIGAPGCTMEQARYVPIAADRLADAISSWERYMHAEAPGGLLVQAALLHAEFEALHPFLDGNGRLGRMLIPLFLWQRKLLSGPRFYISAHFEAEREAYYERLLAVSRDGDWSGWCRFFLRAVQAQADDNLEKVRSIINLYESMKRNPVMVRSHYSIRALEQMFVQPICNSTDFGARSGIPAPTARRFLSALESAGILKTLVPASGRKPAVMAFPALLDIINA